MRVSSEKPTSDGTYSATDLSAAQIDGLSVEHKNGSLAAKKDCSQAAKIDGSSKGQADSGLVFDAVTGKASNETNKTDGGEHEGHRERMWKRLLNSPEDMNDHEVLEMMLFNVVPRMNTNGLAHRLLRRFTTLKGVLEARPEEIIAVDGANVAIAEYLILYGEIMRRTDKIGDTEYLSTENEARLMIEKIGSSRKEHVVIVTATEKGKIISRLYFSDSERSDVMFNIPYLKSLMNKGRAKHLLVGHNHPSGILQPSEADIKTYRKLDSYCNNLGYTLCGCLIVNAKSYITLTANNYDFLLKEKLTKEELEDGKIFEYSPAPKGMKICDDPDFPNYSKEPYAEELVQKTTDLANFSGGKLGNAVASDNAEANLSGNALASASASGKKVGKAQKSDKQKNKDYGEDNYGY